MTTTDTIKNHAAFIWSVADLLRGDYKQSEYGRVIDRTVALTAQSRKTMGLLGAPTDSLLLFRAANSYGGDGPKVFRMNLAPPHTVYRRWHAVANLTTDGGTPLKVTFQRLRLTEQVLNTRRRQNTAAVSESIYRQPDEQTREQAAAAIIRGQSEALEHAPVTVRPIKRSAH